MESYPLRTADDWYSLLGTFTSFERNFWANVGPSEFPCLAVLYRRNIEGYGGEDILMEFVYSWQLEVLLEPVGP